MAYICVPRGRTGLFWQFWMYFFFSFFFPGEIKFVTIFIINASYAGFLRLKFSNLYRPCDREKATRFLCEFQPIYSLWLLWKLLFSIDKMVTPIKQKEDKIAAGNLKGKNDYMNLVRNYNISYLINGKAI